MPTVALTGGAYTARSVIASAQRAVNLYAEPMPEAQGEPGKAAHYPTPGLRFLGTIGSGPIRGIRRATTGTIFVVSGSGVYSVQPDTVDGWYGTHLGDITYGLRTPVGMADNGLDMVIVDGTASGWKISLSDNTFSPLIQSGTLSPVTGVTGTDPIVRDNARYTPFVPTMDGRVTSVTVSLGAGFAGHMKCSIFSAGLGEVLGSASPRVYPTAGVNTFLFPNTVQVTNGGEYWLGFDCDQSAGTWNRGSVGAPGATSNTPYASFPVASPSPTSASPLICTITMESDPGGMFAGADRVDFLDTYLLFNKPNTPQFYSSDSLALTFDPLWFANKEAYSDLLRTLVVVKRDIWLLGEMTTEVWANVGKEDFPFESQPDVFIDHGVAAKYSVANYDNALFWLCNDRQGHGFVIQGAGYQTKRISTYAIEAEFAGYPRIDDAIGFTYLLAGHAFYVIAFPTADKTWSYDITTGHWHEWVWIDANGAEHRHRANCCWPVDGVPIVGDHQNGNIYALDLKQFTDNGKPIKRLRSFPHGLNEGKRLFFRQFLADFETGNAPQIPIVVSSPPATEGGFEALPLAGGVQGAAYAISADGNVTVGSAALPGGGTTRHACYWVGTTGPTIIGPSNSEAYGVSSDGSIIAGYQSGLLWRWTAAGGLVTFGTANDSIFGMSADGSRMVGSTVTTREQACYWNAAGTRTLLGYLPGHDTSRAMAASTDGSVIIGWSYDHLNLDNTERAWRWTSGGGMVSLGVAGTATASRAMGVSADGGVVVGGLLTSSGGDGAFRWTAGTGMVAMPEMIIATGVSGDSGTIIGSASAAGFSSSFLGYSTGGVLTVPNPTTNPTDPAGANGSYPDGVSADGRTIVGFSFGANPLPWIYRVGSTPPPPAPTIEPFLNQISLRWSDDRGHSFGSPVLQDIGEIGQYRTSLQWNRLGMARDRVFELSWSVPMPTALQGAWIDVTPGGS